ncbi:uncharacterized protein G2W53_028416 [Senna tora]|uniref:Uncharacterized protein n=1 Tax=Senna tora TaxID=362788 RepID=A0A834W9Q2_9FABA|nr:uncharacterized protein G2W53_028416 [Senna tora]
MISRYDGPHSCASTAIAKDHPKLDSDMIAGEIASLVAEKVDIPISLVVETVKKARGFTVSYKKAWRGKQKAIARVYGSWVASYNKLTDNTGTGWQPPLGHNVLCIRHVASNLNSKFRNRAIRGTVDEGKPRVHRPWLSEEAGAIRLLNKDAATWIEKIPREKWVCAYDGGRHYDHMTTNLAECMNVVLKGSQINAEHVLCLELRDTIFTNLEIMRICKVTLRNEDLGEYEVEEPYNQQERMPGRHCTVYLSQRPMMHNPQALRPLGRPRSTRIRNEMDWKELGNKPKCSLCSVEEHTKKKCPNKKPMQPQMRPDVAPPNRAGEVLSPTNSSPRDEAAFVLAEKETENPFPGLLTDLTRADGNSILSPSHPCTNGELGVQNLAAFRNLHRPVSRQVEHERFHVAPNSPLGTANWARRQSRGPGWPVGPIHRRDKKILNSSLETANWDVNSAFIQKIVSESFRFKPIEQCSGFFINCV